LRSPDLDLEIWASSFSYNPRAFCIFDAVLNVPAARTPRPAPGHLAAVELTLTQLELKMLDEVSTLANAFQAADRLEPVDRWERFREPSKPR
jgi:hypothetical protein